MQGQILRPRGYPPAVHRLNVGTASCFSPPVIGKYILAFLVAVEILLLLGGSCAVQASPLPVLSPPCSNKDRRPKIAVSKCRGVFGMPATTCNRLRRQCYCQHNIVMKMVGAACPGTRGNGVRASCYDEYGL